MVRALAVMWARNEGDIIERVIEYLDHQGIDVLVCENWSDDETWESVEYRALDFDYSPYPLRIERWPLVRPASSSWAEMLRFTEITAQREAMRGYDWILHHDADEFRSSSRPGERLIDAIARLDAEGYTAINHRVNVYKPAPEWDGSTDPREAMTERYADHVDYHNFQVKCWKQPPDVRVDLAGSAGHSVSFPGIRVAPELLVMDHYPLRGREQMARKLAARERWDAEERARGWHLPHEERVKA